MYFIHERSFETSLATYLFICLLQKGEMTQWRGNKRQALSPRKEARVGYLIVCQRIRDIVPTCFFWFFYSVLWTYIKYFYFLFCGRRVRIWIQKNGLCCWLHHQALYIKTLLNEH